MLLLADIMRTETEDGSESSKTDQLNVLVQAHALVIKQVKYILIIACYYFFQSSLLKYE